ncbi:MAG: hypothetical protein U0794_18490 [Isosphaeraceae bacterium]
MNFAGRSALLPITTTASQRRLLSFQYDQPYAAQQPAGSPPR